MVRRPAFCTGGQGEREHRVGCECSSRPVRLTLSGSSLDHPCQRGVEWVVSLPLPPVREARQEWFYHSGCVCNHINALANRVGACVPYPSKPSLIVLSVLATSLAQSVGFCRQLPLQSIVDGFRGMRRRRYQRALDDYRLRGLLKGDSKVKMFVKLEGVKFTHLKVNPSCRAIQWRNPVFTLLASSYYKMPEHKLYLTSDAKGFPPGKIFAKNLNPRQRCLLMREKYESLPGCEMFELDASRFDSHVTEDLVRHCENVFWSLTNGCSEFSQLLGSKYFTKGSFVVDKVGHPYMVRGGRMSGDADTAASNCILMACLLAAFGNYVTGNRGGSYNFICDGDDSVFYYTGSKFDNDFVVSYFRKFGMTMKVDNRSHSFESIGFCQARPCFIAGSWLLVRDPIKILSKTTVNPKFKIVGLRPKLLKTIATGELSIYAGVPVIDPFLTRLIASADMYMSNRGKRDGGLLNSDRWQSYRVRRDLPSDWRAAKSLPITDEARLSFSSAWGIGVLRQVDIEKRLSSWVCELFAPMDTGEAVDGHAWEYDWRRPELPLLG